MKKNILIFCFALLGTLLLSSCVTNQIIEDQTSIHQPSGIHDNIPTSSVGNPLFWQASTDIIWGKLQQIPLDKLIISQNTPGPYEAAWIKLAIISKRDSVDSKQLAQALMVWRTRYPTHPANQLFPNDETLTNLINMQPPKRIAVLLPLSGNLASLGRATRNGFLNSYYHALSKTAYQQNISFYDTNNSSAITSLYQEAASKGADIIVGPLTKDNVKQLLTQGSFTTPTLALNYTDNWGSLPTNFYQFGLSVLDETKQIADKAWSTGHTRAIIIAPQTPWGQAAAKSLIARWQTNGGKITDSYYYTPQSNLSSDIPQLLHIDTKQDRERSRNQDDKNSLEQQRRHDFDVIFLLAPPPIARQIVPLLRYYYVGKTSIYATSVIYSGSPQPQNDMDLNGVFFCDIPWILGRSANKAGSNRLFAVGHDAYSISHNLSRFSILPNFPLYGATGAITLTPQKQFYRRLAWTQFHNGQP
jgi:outer membrane PBP1 activator LpoA protein